MEAGRVARLLKGWRKKYGLSQSQAAKALNKIFNLKGDDEVSVRSLQNWEIGHRTPKGIAKAALLKALKEPPPEI